MIAHVGSENIPTTFIHILLVSIVLCLTLLVLYWTGTWWSGVDDERVKEGKRLIFPGLPSQLSHSMESARNREIVRERDSERERERERDSERERERQTRGPKL